MNAIRVAAGFVVLAVLTSCSDLCSNEIVQSVASPSGSLKAVVFTRDCGATTGISTQVSILGSGRSLPNEGGNAFIIGDIAPVVLEWKSDAALLVSGFGGHKAFKQGTAVSGVTITYAK
jgi:hypothetical protein